jgi:hypothetical protein
LYCNNCTNIYDVINILQCFMKKNIVENAASEGEM